LQSLLNISNWPIVGNKDKDRYALAEAVRMLSTVEKEGTRRARLLAQRGIGEVTDEMTRSDPEFFPFLVVVDESQFLIRDDEHGQFVTGKQLLELHAETEDAFGIGEEQLEVLTICILQVRNGFTVIGKAAPADPGNFDADLGKKFAYEDAVRQLWPLYGFALREELSRTTEP
jgi:hypothetical protein